jgi:hypothetical protein
LAVHDAGLFSMYISLTRTVALPVYS